MPPQILVTRGNKVLKRDYTRRSSPQNIYKTDCNIFDNSSAGLKILGLIPISAAICKTLRALRALRAWVRDTKVEACQQL